MCELMLNFIIPQVEKERNKRKSGVPCLTPTVLVLQNTFLQSVF